MRIALILTGGTICSRPADDGMRRSDVDTASTVLEQHYRNARPYSSVQFDVSMPLNQLSEDLTPDDWCTLLRAVAAVDPANTDGIIIAHGTDTLEQTAAMLSAALCGISIPVILVSAIEPLSSPQTNGHANFEAAVRLICKRLTGGVWVTYENSDGEMYLHRGFELQPCAHESRSFFSSTMQRVSAVFNAPCVHQKSACIQLQTLAERAKFAPDVLLLRPYTGQRYDRISLEGVSAVVHATYHSETANAALYTPYSVQHLLMRCNDSGIPCFLAPCQITEQSYGSSYDLVQAGAIPLGGMTVPFAYAAVWVSCLLGYEGEALVSHVRQLRYSLESQLFRCCI